METFLDKTFCCSVKGSGPKLGWKVGNFGFRLYLSTNWKFCNTFFTDYMFFSIMKLFYIRTFVLSLKINTDQGHLLVEKTVFLR